MDKKLLFLSWLLVVLVSAIHGQTELQEVPIFYYFPVPEVEGTTADIHEMRYAISAYLGVDPLNDRLIDELAYRQIQIAGIFQLYFSARTRREIAGPNNGPRVEEELINTLNRMLRSGPVDDIQYTKFLFLLTGFDYERQSESD